MLHVTVTRINGHSGNTSSEQKHQLSHDFAGGVLD